MCGIAGFGLDAIRGEHNGANDTPVHPSQLNRFWRSDVGAVAEDNLYICFTRHLLTLRCFYTCRIMIP